YILQAWRKIARAFLGLSWPRLPPRRRSSRSVIARPDRPVRPPVRSPFQFRDSMAAAGSRSKRAATAPPEREAALRSARPGIDRTRAARPARVVWGRPSLDHPFNHKSVSVV